MQVSGKYIAFGLIFKSTIERRAEFNAELGDFLTRGRGRAGFALQALLLERGG